MCRLLVTDNTTYVTFSTLPEARNWTLLPVGVPPFENPNKASEHVRVLGLRVFPRARWIVWTDGKFRRMMPPFYVDGRGANASVLDVAIAPVMMKKHPWMQRVAGEFDATLSHLGNRAFKEKSLPEIRAQRKVYESEGRLDVPLDPNLLDIAVIAYRNHVPAVRRFYCAWLNDISQFSHRGQLSVLYAAYRTEYPPSMLQRIPGHWFDADHHSQKDDLMVCGKPYPTKFK